MSVQAIPLPRWSTASYADATESVPAELENLSMHYSVCNGGRSRWFGLQCVGESIHGFIVPRIFTTLLVATAFIALISFIG